MDTRFVDILLFGASGFTGIGCISYLHNLSKENGRCLNWGIAGRSEQTLKKALANVGEEIGVDLGNTPIILADVTNYQSLVEMTAKARIILNCCGPFELLGENVVKACIETGTHHLDITGEPLFMERIQLKYHEAAKEKGIYIVSACGMDSIPTDLSVAYLQKTFDGVLNSIEIYYKFDINGNLPGINYGTWASVVDTVANHYKIREIRKITDATKPKLEPKLHVKHFLHKTHKQDGWIFPVPNIDRQVINRSQKYLNETENKRPIQIAMYTSIKNLYTGVILLIFSMLFIILTKFKFGQNLLLKYPAFFSHGLVSKEKPTKYTMDNTIAQWSFYGEGWSQYADNKKRCDRRILATFYAKNPGYDFTCVILVLCGITVLLEKDKCAGHGSGGAYTPGAAFANTSLMDELRKHGFSLNIVYNKSL